MSPGELQQAVEKVRGIGGNDLGIEVFARHLLQMTMGKGFIREEQIEPLNGAFETLDSADERKGLDALARTAVLKLSGGLGTTLGLHGPKSGLQIRPDTRILDLGIRQVLAARSELGVPLPLTYLIYRPPGARAAGSKPEFSNTPSDIPRELVQNAVPRLRENSLEPLHLPATPEAEWCPPGHGDVFAVMAATAYVDRLLAHGYRHVFISNADNLTATPDARIAAWVAAREADVVIETCRRTVADRKGGHLAVRKKDRRLVVRDNGQVHPADAQVFGDVRTHSVFSTNSLWINLGWLRNALDARAYLDLPLIVNRKTVDDGTPDGVPVVQLETGAGAIISIADDVAVLEVPRSRLLPVKTTNDLLLIRSDLYTVHPDGSVARAADAELPDVDLDPRFFGTVDAFDRRFADGVPSVVGASLLRVRGDVGFGAGVEIVGELDIAVSDGNKLVLPEGTRIGSRRRDEGSNEPETQQAMEEP